MLSKYICARFGRCGNSLRAARVERDGALPIPHERGRRATEHSIRFRLKFPVLLREQARKTTEPGGRIVDPTRVEADNVKVSIL
jgi:hypothetical protein